MLGATEDELLGERLRRASSHPDDRARRAGGLRARRAAARSSSACATASASGGTSRRTSPTCAHDRQIRGVVLNARDITERVRLEEELTRQAFHDGLTGLANRALFRDRLDQALARSARARGEPLCRAARRPRRLQAGQRHASATTPATELLQQVAQPLRRGRSAPGDTLARLGGDEFALLLEDDEEPGGRARASGCSSASPSRSPSPAASSRSAPASASSLHPAAAGASEELVRHADVAMYAAKEAGRGRYEVFRDEMARELGELLGLEHELRLGLQRGEFTVHYQPRGRPRQRRDRRRRGARCAGHSPTRGIVPPDAVHPGRRGHRPDHAARRVRAARGLRADGRAGAATASCPSAFVTWVNLSGKQLSAGGVARARRASALADDGPPAGVPRARGHRDGDRRRTGAAGERARAELEELHDLGVRDRDRRLRHRLLVARPAAPLPGRRDQGRPLVRPGRRARPEGRGDHGEPRQPRARARPRRDRRGHRVRGPARLGARARLRPRAGLPLRASDPGRKRSAPCSPRRGRSPTPRSGCATPQPDPALRAGYDPAMERAVHDTGGRPIGRGDRPHRTRARRLGAPGGRARRRARPARA